METAAWGCLDPENMQNTLQRNCKYRSMVMGAAGGRALFMLQLRNPDGC